MQFFAVLLSTVALAVSTIATPLHVAERRQVLSNIDIWYPPLGAVWVIGTEAYICWFADSTIDGTTPVFAYLESPTGNSGPVQDTQLQPAGGQTVTFSNICVAFIVPSVAPGNGYSVMLEAILSNGNPRFGYSASFSVQSD